MTLGTFRPPITDEDRAREFFDELEWFFKGGCDPEDDPMRKRSDGSDRPNPNETARGERACERCSAR